MTAQHTPGPWAIKEYNNGHTGEYGLHGIFEENVKGQQQQTPIVEKVWGTSIEESDANAKLIAAAPDLLEALEDARAELDISMLAHEVDSTPYNALKEAISRIDAVIAKARGQ